MARSRNIKPSFFTNEVLADCDPLARLLFEGLWCHADRTGALEYRPKKLKVEILPYDECDIAELMYQLLSREFIKAYVVDGVLYIFIPTFEKHQNPHVNEKPKGLPPIKKGTLVPARCWHSVATVPIGLIPDSFNLIPDSLEGAALPPTDGVPPEDVPPAPEEPKLPAPREPRAEDILLPPELDTPEFRTARDAWIAQRRRRRLSLRVEHIERQYVRLLPLGSANAAACLMHTVDNDYDGIFPEKFNGKSKQPSRVGAGQRYQGD